MKLILGSAQFGMHYGISNKTGKPSLHGIESIIQFCVKNEINRIDTAIDYGDSEKNLGHVGVDAFKIITKINPNKFKKNINDHFLLEIEKSINRLKVDNLDTVLIHNSENITQDNEEVIFKSLLSLKEKGLTKKIGISSFDKKNILNLSNKYKFDVVQTPCNLFDQSLIKSELHKNLNDKEIEIHARSVFLQGLLLMKKNKLPKKFDKWKTLLDSYYNWLEDNKVLPIQAALSYVKQYKEISGIVVGVNKLSELKDIIKFYNKDWACNAPDFTNFITEKFINPSYWDNL